MSHYVKIGVKILVIFGIFALILFLNTKLQAHNIKMAWALDPCSDFDYRYNLACLAMSGKGEVPINMVIKSTYVGFYYMCISSALFVFFGLMFFDPKYYKKLTPIFTLLWMVLGEIFIKIFDIEVITKSLLGKISVFDSLYLGFFHNEIIIIIPILFFIGAITGIIAYYLSSLIREKLKKSPESV